MNKEAQEVEEVVETEEVEEVVESTLSESQQEASERGWTGKEAWVEAGHDADDWVSAERFLEKGQMISTIRRLESEKVDFDKRIRSTERLAQEMLKAKIEDLEEKRDEATSDGSLEKSKGYQKQIDDVKDNAAKESESTGEDPIIIQWNKENPWIDNPGPKSEYAGRLYNRCRPVAW